MINRLSVVVITKNEEDNIEDCLKSVQWADEIVVIDSGSSDRTVEIAGKYTNKIFIEDWQGYSHAKNFGISKTTGDWILSIDADERVTPELADELKMLLRENNLPFSGYQVARRAYFLGKWIKYCGWYPGYVTRFYKKGIGSYNEARVHEKFEFTGESGILKNDLLHFTDPSLDHYYKKFDTYTTLAAENLHLQNKKFRVSDITIRPVFTFFRMYILQRGFLDGKHGLVLCLLSAFYVFSKYVKLWELKISNQLLKYRGKT